MILLKQWWQQLSKREQVLLTFGGFVAVNLMYYAIFLAPLSESIERQKRQLAAQRNELHQLDILGQQAIALRQQKRTRPSTPVGNMLRFVDRSAREHGIASAIQRVRPDSERSVRLWFSQVPFPKLLQWLDTIDRDYGVYMESSQLQRGDAPGLVEGQLKLTTATLE